MNSLAPSFLLSMPQLGDPNFRQAVVLLCLHGEEGAFGLIVNRPAKTRGRILVTLDPPVTTERHLEIWLGGPVEPERSLMLVGSGQGEAAADSLRVTDGLHLSRSPELLRRVVEPNPPPDVRLMVGYAGWGRGQLENELESSFWLVSDVDPDLIFKTPADQMWERAIRRLGADPAALQVSRGVH